MPKQPLTPIIGPRVRLRLLTAADLLLTRAWRNQDHIRKWFLTSEVISPEQHAAWFTAYAERDNDLVFIIEESREESQGKTKNLHKPVGQISLYNIEWGRKQAEYGRLMIGEADATRRGLARQATELLLGWAFGQLGLETLQLKVRQDNQRAIALYEQCGFCILDTQHCVHTMRLGKDAYRDTMETQEKRLV